MQLFKYEHELQVVKIRFRTGFLMAHCLVTIAIAQEMQGCGFDPCVGKIPWSEFM